MGRLIRILLLIAGGGCTLALNAGGQEAAPKPAAKAASILWSRTWEGALREASIRNVPIYIIVSIGEG